MRLRNGGIIGRKNRPSPNLASGIWTLVNASEYIKEGIWPGNWISGVFGGTVTDITTQQDINYRVHTFTGNDNLIIQNGGKLEYLVVAGGGGSGSSHAGGGGAGGVLTGILIISNGTYPITIGQGGTSRVNGSNSSLGSLVETIGGGCGDIANSSTGRAGNGGSGGGAGMYTVDNGTFGSGIPGQGHDGGNHGGYLTISGNGRGGGGGGAGQPGFSGLASMGTANSGRGGDGISSEITGDLVFYGGGGGGASWQGSLGTVSTGGLGGGGNGGRQNSTLAQNGLPNRGGGAGTRGGSSNSGGSGIVIIRYRI